ncbi:unnamed protein product, partial [Prorocentrum cordatum]
IPSRFDGQALVRGHLRLRAVGAVGGHRPGLPAAGAAAARLAGGAGAVRLAGRRAGHRAGRAG